MPVGGGPQAYLVPRGDDHARRRLREEQDVGAQRARQVEAPAEARRLPAEGALGQGHGQAAVARVVSGEEQARVRGVGDESL